MTKRKDLSKALGQVENSKGTHHAIDFKPGPRIAMVDSLMNLSKLMILYIDLRHAVNALMALHDFRQELDSIVHPTNSEWFEALQRVESAMNAIRDLEVGIAGATNMEFPAGVASFDVGNEPSVTVEVFRDEAGNIIDSHEKYKEWQRHIGDRMPDEVQCAGCDPVDGCPYRCDHRNELKDHPLHGK